MAKKMRLDKLLGHMGFGSRKELKVIITKGLVTVNDEVVRKSSIQVDAELDKVMVGDLEVVYKEFVYILMNKPQGVISATQDSYHETVVDIVSEDYGHFDVFPVGRLDIDTEGLLILTNDGKFSHKVLSPKKHVPKTYYALVDGIVTEKDIQAFKRGVTFTDDDYTTLPSELEIIKSDETSEIRLTIYEGKFHQVKRMFQAVGKEVTYLKRVAMGGFKLDEVLELGDYRELTEEELEQVFIY